MQVTKVTKTGAKSQLTVSDSVFGAPVNKTLIAQAVRVYLFNQRQGSSKAKTRSEVNRTSAKWYKQKGTGRARHGARNAPLFVGGGVAHGPNGEQNWNRELPKRMKLQALVSALSAQAANVFVADTIAELAGKTKEAAAFLHQIVTKKDKVLVVLNEFKPEVVRSLRNVENVLLTRATRLNALEAAMADKIVMTSDAVATLEARVAGELKPVKAKAESKKETKTTEKPVVKKAVKPVAKAAPKKAAAKPAAKKTTKKAAK